MSLREFQLLLHCAKNDVDVKSLRKLVDEGIDWQNVLDIAQRHRVRPLLHRGLKFACWDAVPQPRQVELETFDRSNLQRNLLCTRELLRLLKMLQNNGIAVITFKGPVLASSAYGNLSLREFNDLDLMVHPAEVHRAEDILTASGYQAQFADRDYRSEFVSYQGQYAFRHAQTGLWIDLHWQFSSKGMPFPLRVAEVWANLRQVTISGETVPTFAMNDLVLFLAAHGTKEGWRRLIWVCDFAQLLWRCQEIDWPEIIDRANRSHCSRPVLLACFLASTLLGAPVPANLVDAAHANPAVQSLAEKARLRMLSTAPQGELSEFLNSLYTHDRLRDRLWPIAALLTTPTVGDHQTIPLPKPCWGIYYLLRPFRLLLKAARILFGRRHTNLRGPGKC